MVDLKGEAVFREKRDFYPVGLEMKAGEYKIDIPKLGRTAPKPVIQPADLYLSIDPLFPKPGNDSPQKASCRRGVENQDKDEETTDYPDHLAKKLAK